MLFFLLPLMISISFVFTRMSHPLSAGLTLLVQTVLIATSAGLLTHSFWVSYIMFLIFLGAMLVLFIYVASLAANEQFDFNLTMFLMAVFFSVTLTTLIFFSDLLHISSPVNIELSSHANIYLENLVSSSTSSLYETTSTQFTLFVISYLLLTLIIIVKIMNIKNKPLRSSF